MTMTVPFVAIGKQYEEFREEILQIFDAISKTGHHVLGPHLHRFEESFAAYCGTRFAVGVGNGSDALTYSLLAHGIGAGDEVITAPNSFVASAWTIANVDATLVFADVGDDYNLDPEKVEAAITPKTRAIMPVHLTGQIADMAALKDIARRHNLIVVEDSAQAVGATQNGQKAGSFGHTGCFSLHPLKNLHVHGDGGVLTTNDKEVAKKVRQLRNHGLINRDECEFWGYNSRLDEIQAAIASIKLSHLDRLNDRHRQIAKRYGDALSDFVRVPVVRKHNQPVFHRYIIRHKSRNELARQLAERGVETKINYPIPLHRQQAAAELDYKDGDFPIAEQQAREILSLPMHPYMTEDEIDHVITSIMDIATTL